EIDAHDAAGLRAIGQGAVAETGHRSVLGALAVARAQPGDGAESAGRVVRLVDACRVAGVVAPRPAADGMVPLDALARSVRGANHDRDGCAANGAPVLV